MSEHGTSLSYATIVNPRNVPAAAVGSQEKTADSATSDSRIADNFSWPDGWLAGSCWRETGLLRPH